MGNYSARNREIFKNVLLPDVPKDKRSTFLIRNRMAAAGNR